MGPAGQCARRTIATYATGLFRLKHSLILVHVPRATVLQDCRSSIDNSLAPSFHCPIRRRRSRLVASKVDARRRLAYSHADMPDPPRWPECPAWPLQLRLCSRCSIPQSPSTTTYRRERSEAHTSELQSLMPISYAVSL